MRQSRKRSVNARTVLSFFGVFLPSFVVLLVTGIAGYQQQLRSEELLAERNESLLVAFQSTLITNQLGSIIEDMKYLAVPTRELEEYLKSSSGAPISDEIAEYFASFVRRRMNLSSCTLFDSGGNELFRIEYHEGTTVVAPADPDGSIDSAYYLSHSLALPSGAVFVSRMDLSIRGRPIIRFIARLSTDTDRRYFIEIAYDAGRFIDTIRNSSAISSGDIMLVDSLGYWLVSPRRDEEWGFLDPTGMGRSFASERREVWEAMRYAPSGSFRTEDGVFVYETVYPIMDPLTTAMKVVPRIIYDPGPYEAYSSRSGAGGELHWYLISFIPEERIRRQLATYRSRLLNVSAVVLVLLTLVSVLLALTRKRRLLAEAMVEEEASIFMHNPAPVIRLARDGAIDKLNPAAARIFDRSTAGARSGDLFTCFDFDEVKRLPESEPYQFEQQIGDRHYLFSVRRQPGDSSCLLYGSDITAIREIEREIRKLSTAVEQSATAILITDLEGSITFANEACAEISGYTISELTGNHTRLFRSGYQGEEVYKELWDTISSGGVWHGSLRNRKKSGEVYWEDVNITPLRSDDGEISGYLAVKEDITTRRAAEEQLRSAKDQAEAASRLKSEFLANMSHEIRTPLNAIMGFTDVLLDEERRSDGRKHLEIIKSSGKHLLALINDILDFSKIEADKVRIEQGAFAIRRVIDHLAHLLGESLREKELTFESSIADSVPAVVSGDEHRITQVLLNVLSNAIKFTHSGGITLDCSYDGRRLRIAVTDTGIGIEQDKLGMIFDAFEQANSSTERMYGGTGLGLAITKRLVELMRGRIDVESTPGVGSTFTITLPLLAVSADPVELTEEVNGAPERQGMTDRWFQAMGNDEMLQEVLRKGIRDLPSKLEKLERAYADGDPAKLLLVAHDLKGYSGNLGMQEIYSVAKELHDGIRREQLSLEQCGELLLRLRRTIEAIPPSHFDHSASPVSSSFRGAGDGPRSKARLRVLVAEDNEANRELVRALLAGLDVESSFVENGREVLSALEQSVWDLLLLDMQMPVMDGLETLRIIRAKAAWDDLAVIAVTAHAMKGDAERYLSLGCNDYIAKPIDRAAFREKIISFRAARL